MMRRPQPDPATLLDWYGRHARLLPWRAPPGSTPPPDPYRVWLSEVMLQQTTVAAVTERFLRFVRRWPTVEALAEAPLEEVLGEWAGLGYYARARNLHRCAVAVAARGGFPDTEEELRALPGIGAYTAAAVAAIAFGRRAVVVDGNVERVMARLFAIDTPFPAGKAEARRRAEDVWPDARSGDFAQALMDLGATVCTPRSPSCLVCPLADACLARRANVAEAFPKRAAKATRPERRGVAFVLFDGEGRVLLERRAEKGLLGGMPGLPGAPWSTEGPTSPEAQAPCDAGWRSAGSVRHVFTHFALALEVRWASARMAKAPAKLFWADPDAAGLPTVMKKAVALAQEARRTTTDPAE
ncbi:MAG: A/G-specific adenine glycosylase [Parvularculaceae bacterium]|nr:A/G-specific adenine glycosylase [Parvularculaceae bacterium]